MDIYAHRGASHQLPQHTIEAYELALIQGADRLEIDLVATGDGILIARHDARWMRQPMLQLFLTIAE